VIIEVFKDTDCDNVQDIGGTEFFIPEGFSPNGDGIHDFFEILGMEEYPDAEMYIFTRWGSQIFHKKNYGNLDVWGTQKDAWWDGYSYNSLTLGKNTKVPPGNYLYILHLGNGVTYKGTVMVSY
jgi:gliding motility-associated-like protein